MTTSLLLPEVVIMMVVIMAVVMRMVRRIMRVVIMMTALLNICQLTMAEKLQKIEGYS